MHHVSWLSVTFLLFTILPPALSEESLYENVTCGSFLGDKRYCLDLSNTDLAEPPVGWNITTILDLSANHIREIDGNRFKDQVLLVELDLSNNEIRTIDIQGLQNLKNLKKVSLGNNEFVCDVTICPFQSWLRANEHKVQDVDLVTCAGPVEMQGRKVIDIDTSFFCRNVTLNHGFEINTGTVFMIWIVVPILITSLTALYIVVNGNNRVGRLVRSSLWSCCRGVYGGRQASMPVWAPTEDPPTFHQDERPQSAPSRPLTPVECVEQEMVEVTAGPSNFA